MEEVEQITKNIEESPSVIKQKDPKKVAAGKTLARKNAEARKIKKTVEKVDSPDTISSIYDGVKSLAGAVGVGLTLYQGYQIYKSYRPPPPESLVNSTPAESLVNSTPAEVRKTMEF